MGIAERLATAVSASDLRWSENATKSVEFVAAMSGATNLGSDILRSKDRDRGALHRAVLLLARKAWRAGHKRKIPMSDAQARRMAAVVLLELIRPNCRTCTGAGVSVIDDLKVTCPTCEGITVHRYTDKERARLCGIHPSKWDLWESRYELVLSIARGHDCAPMMARIRLGYPPNVQDNRPEAVLSPKGPS